MENVFLSVLPMGRWVKSSLSVGFLTEIFGNGVKINSGEKKTLEFGSFVA
jgi:hypothetical protein